MEELKIGEISKPRLSAPVPEKVWEIGMSDKPLANE